MSGAAPLFLTGFMGSGKTTVGRLVAERLRRPFADTDELVEARAGAAIASLVSREGEAAFRRLERRCLETLLGDDGDAGLVVATGGGLWLAAPARRLMLARGVVLWLDVPLDEARRRVGEGPDRPLWPARDRIALRELYERRRAAYALASRRIDASGPPAEVAGRVMGALGRGHGAEFP